MTSSARPLVLALVCGATLLLLAGTSHAQYRGYREPIATQNHMPGWDWWRTYPWSPYNYGRNPYNPIRVPYIEPYPVYTPMYQPYGYPYSYGVPSTPTYDEPVWGHSDAQQQLLIPHPSGAVTVPPADAAIIRLYIPDRFGEVLFDGVQTSSYGTTRYYVTPDLPRDKTMKYTVTARFHRNGQPVTEEKTISVNPGRTSQVDFR
jgi:uncharacterized protein (TIGR03000 family)